MACCMWVYHQKQLCSCFHLTGCPTLKELVAVLNHSITYTNQTVVNCLNDLLCTEKREEGRGEERDRERRRGEERRRRERRKRRKEKGEDERGKKKGKVSHDILEADTSSGWAH